VPNRGVVLVQLVKLALLEEEHRVVVVLLDLPELLLERCKRVPRLAGNVDCARVVLRVPGAVAVLVLDVDKEVKARLRLALLLLGLELLALGGGEKEVVRVLG